MEALQRHALKVWKLAEPILLSLVGDSLKKYLGLA
jgi:hypothetical protein